MENNIMINISKNFIVDEVAHFRIKINNLIEEGINLDKDYYF